jgi:hypothetical protein
MSKLYCTTCGTVAAPKTTTKGSFIIEIILWLFMILPGVIYTVWRLSSRQKGCPSCGSTAMVPVSSPIAQKALSNQQ